MAASANRHDDLEYPRHSRSPPASKQHKHISTVQLPEGACNYRDLNAGPKPPGCGCRRFWIAPTFGRVGLGLSQPSEPWCACGHHACYHAEKRESTRANGKSVTSSLTSKESLGNPRTTIEWPPASETTQPWLRRGVQLADLDIAHEQIQSAPRLLSGPSGHPQVPSFHLTSSELRGHAHYSGSVGLGLDLQRGIYAARKVTQSPTVADAASLGDEIPSTRQPSTDDRVSPSNAFMRHISNTRRDFPRPDTNTTSAALVGLGLGDLPQSATEVATPSVSAVSNVTDAAHLIQDASEVVNLLEQGVTTVEAPRDHQARNGHRASQASLKEDMNGSTQTVRDALRQIPAALQRLGPLLESLQTQVARNPDISIHESIISLVKRMDALENASFNHLPPEQVHERFQDIDVRLSELEAKTDEHGRLIAGLKPDSERSASYVSTKKKALENTSFTSYTSGQSLDSATSSALIAAAIDRVEAVERLKAVEDRLDTLETLQLPSLSLPWRVEVVIMPWGEDLRGIWYRDTDFKSLATTQDNQEFTQAHSGKGHTKASASLAESGWNERSIQDWANNDDEKLWPKAAGVNGVVYHRLKSRGLVRDITLTGPGARDVAVAITKAFGELLETITRPPESEAMDEDVDEDELFGLTAPILPLRKIHKSSCLRFLSGAELVTPTLWNAEFLASGVLMRASAGQKRLFVTTKSGYIQHSTAGWTWAGLRQLPRVHDPASQSTAAQSVPEADAMEPCWKHHPALDDSTSAGTSFYSTANDSAYVEARALTQASQSNESHEHRPVDLRAASTSRQLQPITPVSEFPPTLGSQHHRTSRTLSTSLSEAAILGKSKTGSLPQAPRPTSQQSKRRIRSFEQAANPALIAILPSFVPSPAKGSIRLTRIKKRRRITRSKSASSAEFTTQSSGQFEAQSLPPEADPHLVLQHLQEVIPQGGEIMPLSHFWPRSRSRETAQSLPVDGATATVGAERQVQGRVADKRGVTPSAYATPFSGTVAGFGDHDEDYLPSESGDEDWGGVDDGLTSDTDAHEIDDDMSEDGSEEGRESEHEDNDEHEPSDDEDSDMVQDEDDDDDMLSSEDEDELQLQG